MTDLDLTEAVTAAARAHFDRGQAARRDDGRKRPDGQPWRLEDLTAIDQHAIRSLVLPIVLAAADPIAAQVWGEGYSSGHVDGQAGRYNAETENPYRGDQT